MIMVLVFGAFILGSSLTIKEFGLGLAVAVFVDAFVIRMGIVPAVMFLFGRFNWGFPGRLNRALPAEGSAGRQTEPAEPVDV